MALPKPKLDDRRFQDIVDEAKRFIPRHCPEWTDHNVSDPGIALIELFAWMTEMMLYRINQIPEKAYIEFLELLGVRLMPPRAATVPVTFYLSAAQPIEVVIPKGTEVATIRTDTSPAIVFTTETDLTVRPAKIVAAFTSSQAAPDAPWRRHDLSRLALPNEKVALFPTPPSAGDAFVLALAADHSNHLVALRFECDWAGGAGVDPEHPPLEWQGWQGDPVGWAPCELEQDGTKGFNVTGEVVLHLPVMAEMAREGVRGHWLRCRLTDAQSGERRYEVSPDLTGVPRAEARGGTVDARHAVTVRDELLGYSDGAPGAAFKLSNTPVLSRDKATDTLIVAPPHGDPQVWHEVDDFADSGPEDRHFTLDSLDGTLALGPALLQPDGSVYRFGAVPPKGSRLTFARYQFGGGLGGNAPQDSISVAKSAIPYVAKVRNRRPATGGRDAQSLADAMLRVPHYLRTRDRAVTASDFEYLACEVPGVARAHCLAPGAQPNNDPAVPSPGAVRVSVLPAVDPTNGPLPVEKVLVSDDLRRNVLAHLGERCLLGCRVEVKSPSFVWVAVKARLRVPEGAEPRTRAKVQEDAEAKLYRYLSPFDGGASGDGWPFGRDLYVSELYGLLQQIANVQFVEEIQVSASDLAGSEPKPVQRRLALPKDGLICSLKQVVIVS